MLVTWAVNHISMRLHYNADWPLCRSFFVQSTYFRDTIEFINKVESMHLEPNTWLIIYNITEINPCLPISMTNWYNLPQKHSQNWIK